MLGDKMVDWFGKNITALLTIIIISISFFIALNIQAQNNKDDIRTIENDVIICKNNVFNTQKNIAVIQNDVGHIKDGLENSKLEQRSINSKLDLILIRIKND